MGWWSPVKRLTRAIESAIDEAAKRHPGAEPLLKYAALLQPEPIPCYLFEESSDSFGEYAPHLKGDALNDAIAALRSFALIERKDIHDERNPDVSTDCIRLHRVVRNVAASRWSEPDTKQARVSLITAMAAAYPHDDYSVIDEWPRARRLDAHALGLVEGGNVAAVPEGVEREASELMDKLGCYRHDSEAAYALARPLFEGALALREKKFPPDHPLIAESLNYLSLLAWAQRRMDDARSLCKRALDIRKKAPGAKRTDVALSMINLARILGDTDDPAEKEVALDYCHQALAIFEGAEGLDHPDVALCLGTIVRLLLSKKDFVTAEPLAERALSIYEKSLRPNRTATAHALSSMAEILAGQGKGREAVSQLERALHINERVLGPDHPIVADTLSRLADVLTTESQTREATVCRERALAIYERTRPSDPRVKRLSALLGRPNAA